MQTLIENEKKIETPAMQYTGKNILVTNSSEKESRFSELQLIKGEIKRLEADKKFFTDPLRQTIKNINERYDEVLIPLATAETIYKNGIQSWDMAEQRRISAENERLRVEAEERARRERERLEARAQKALESGKTEKAESLRVQAEIKASQPIVAPVIHQQKTKGLSYVDHWEVEVTNVSLIPRDFLLPNIKELEAFAKRTAGKSNIAGVKFIYKPIPKATSR